MADMDLDLQIRGHGGMVGMELETSIETIGGLRPRQHGGFSMPLFRGLRAHVQAERLKARRLDLWRGFNPRSASVLKPASSGHSDHRSAAMTAEHGTILSTADLNTEVNHEPRILDLTIAERLGYERPRAIKDLIERNAAELETYGVICRAARQTPSAKGGRPTEDIYLNEGQALVLCALSRTAKAAEVRKEVIEVFMAWRAGRLPVTVKAHQRRRPAARGQSRMDDAIERLERLASATADARLPGLSEIVGTDFIGVLHLHRVDEDTMYPTLRKDRDWALVRNLRTFEGEGIYLLEVGLPGRRYESLYRCDRHPDGIRLMRDNKAYGGPFEVIPADHFVRMVRAKVVFAFTRQDYHWRETR